MRKCVKILILYYIQMFAKTLSTFSNLFPIKHRLTKKAITRDSARSSKNSFYLSLKRKNLTQRKSVADIKERLNMTSLNVTKIQIAKKTDAYVKKPIKRVT